MLIIEKSTALLFLIRCTIKIRKQDKKPESLKDSKGKGVAK
jgi:hypothetical protein